MRIREVVMIWIWWMEFLGLVLLAPVAVSCALGEGRRRVAWWVGVVWVLAWVGVGAGLMFKPHCLHGLFFESDDWWKLWALARPWLYGWGFVGAAVAVAGVWLGGVACRKGMKAGGAGLTMLGLAALMPMTLCELDVKGAMVAQEMHLEGMRLRGETMKGKAPDYDNALVALQETQWRCAQVFRERLWQEEMLRTRNEVRRNAGGREEEAFLSKKDDRWVAGGAGGWAGCGNERWAREAFKPMEGVRENARIGALPGRYLMTWDGDPDELAGLVLADAGRGEKGRMLADLELVCKVQRIQHAVWQTGMPDYARRCYEYALAMNWSAEEIARMPLVRVPEPVDRSMAPRKLSYEYHKYRMLPGLVESYPVLARIFTLMPAGEWTDREEMMRCARYPFETRGTEFVQEIGNVRAEDVAWIESGLPVAKACALYRAKYGKWPGSAEALVPEFLTSVPVDVTDRKTPVRVVEIKGGLRVYGKLREQRTADYPSVYGNSLMVIGDEPGKEP
jgi:hypothetical protein